MKKSFIGRIALAISFLMLLLPVLAGCQQGGEDTKQSQTIQEKRQETATTKQQSTPEEKVNIIFWHTYGDAEEPFFNENVLPKFKEKFPNIEVEAIRQEGGQYNQLIVTAFGTGQTPDVARIDLTNSAAYANQGGIISLDDMEGFAELKDQCLEGPLATNLFRGKYYGLPLDTNCKAAVVNMDVMEKLGFSEPPKTMEEFIEASKKNSPGKYTLNVSGTGDWDTYPYFWLFGGVLTDPGFTKATGYLDSPRSIAALEKMVELHKDNVFTIRDIDGTPDAWDGIKSGEYAMFFEGPWYFGSNPDHKEMNIYPALIPSYNGKSASVVGGENIAIFKDSKHPREAFEFIKFMLSEEIQLLMLQVGQIPVLKSVVESDVVKGNEIWSVYMKQLESADTRIPSPQNTAIAQYWGDAINNVFNGVATPEEALKQAAELIDAELAK